MAAEAPGSFSGTAGSSVASHRIAGALRAEILGGRYAPGERIR